MTSFKNCQRKAQACIEGDIIYIECRTTGKWKKLQMSGQHNGRWCKAKKNAKAIILQSYTNVNDSRKP